MTDEELLACFPDPPTEKDFFPPDFTDQQCLETYPFLLEGFSLEEAIKRVRS